jgi:hypothetical protein
VGSFGDNQDVSVGAILTIPTGDDTAGLGTDSFGLTLFGSLRHKLGEGVFTAHADLRMNQDGNIGLTSLEGKTSGQVGVGLIVPLSDTFAVVGEANLESERFDGVDSDFRLLGGAAWRVSNRGVFRGALTLGLTDGAPDAQILLAYAYVF